MPSLVSMTTPFIGIPRSKHRDTEEKILAMAAAEFDLSYIGLDETLPAS